MSYKTILIGTKTFSLSWKNHLKKIQQPHIILINFNDSEVLSKTLANKQIDYILPLSNRDYNAIIQYDNTLKILYPDLAIYELLDNKMLFVKFMLDNFKDYIPKVFFLDNIQLENIEFPVISKPIFSTGGQNMVIYYNTNEFITCTSKHIIQRFIEDLYEYAAYFLCIDGVIKTSKIIRYKYTPFTIKTGNFPPDYESIEDFDLSIFIEIIKKLNYSGGACINFKLDNGKISIFEINPRFGGSAFTNNFIYDLLCIDVGPGENRDSSEYG